MVTKKCPYCAEEILKAAIKCKHCGSDQRTHPAHKRPVHVDRPTEKPMAKNHPSYGSASLVSFLLPVIGLLMGVVYLTKSDAVARKLGEHAIVVSLLGSVFWYFGYAFLGSSL